MTTRTKRRLAAPMMRVALYGLLAVGAWLVADLRALNDNYFPAEPEYLATATCGSGSSDYRQDLARIRDSAIASHPSYAGVGRNVYTTEDPETFCERLGGVINPLPSVQIIQVRYSYRELEAHRDTALERLSEQECGSSGIAADRNRVQLAVLEPDRLDLSGLPDVFDVRQIGCFNDSEGAGL